MRQLPDSYFTLSRFIRANWFWLLILVIISVIAFASEAQDQPYAVWKIEGSGFASIVKINAPVPDEEYRLQWHPKPIGYVYPSDRAFWHWFSLIMSDDSVMHFFKNSEACVGFWGASDLLGTDGEPHPSRGAAVYDCDLLQSFIEK